MTTMVNTERVILTQELVPHQETTTITNPSLNNVWVKRWLESPLAVKICVSMLIVILGTSLSETPVQTILALLLIVIAVGLYEDEVESIHLAGVAVVGLLISTFSIPQFFFSGLLCFAAYVAVTKEGLLYYFPRSYTEALVKWSIMDFVRALFTRSSNQPNDTEQATSNGPIRSLRRTVKLLTTKGYIFSSLPEGVRWMLLPKDVRDTMDQDYDNSISITTTVKMEKVNDESDEENEQLDGFHVDHILAALRELGTEMIISDVTKIKNKISFFPNMMFHPAQTNLWKRITHFKPLQRLRLRPVFNRDNKEDRVEFLLVVSVAVYLFAAVARRR
jgi:hypothetical protein